jgi:hypothetical protein
VFCDIVSIVCIVSQFWDMMNLLDLRSSRRGLWRGRSSRFVISLGESPTFRRNISPPSSESSRILTKFGTRWILKIIQQKRKCEWKRKEWHGWPTPHHIDRLTVSRCVCIRPITRETPSFNYGDMKEVLKLSELSGIFQVFGNDTNKSELHSRRN